MPLYEYECTSCHRRTEKIQKFSDPELTVCPHCGGPLERTITAAAVSFKGGGWYKDLYSSAKPAAASKEGGGGDSTSGGKVDSVSASASSGDGAKASEPAKPASPSPAPASPAPSASSSSKD
ncbi:MAG: zinc ribbon domain-containing protein [Acidobacteriaceae bacterium]